jgi:hypothetical protein
MKALNFKKGGLEMKTRIFRKYLFTTAVIVMATSLGGCFRLGSLSSGSSGTNGSSNGTASSVPTGAEGPTVAIMDSFQTMPSYTALTGVTPSSSTKTAFNNNVGNLPVGGNAAQLGQPALQAFASIAAGFCDDATTQNATKIYPGISFTGAPSQFTGTTLTNVENAMCTTFWHESTCDATEASALNSLAATCVSNVPATGATFNGKTVTTAIQTETVADCLCTAMLASTTALAH